MTEKNNINKLVLLLGCIFIGIVVTITYFLFENAVRNSTNFLWDTVLDTEKIRIIVIPLGAAMALVFFGLQHFIDPKSEKHEKHGLGGEPIPPTIKNIAIILFLGFFSLLAGASLGPEAVLVPACIVIGSYIGVKLFKNNDEGIKALAAAAIMALMTAFFHSFIVGILSIFLVTKQTQAKVSPSLVVIAVISSLSSYLTLHLIDPTNKYFNFPDFNWKVVLVDLLAGVGLIICGYLATFALKFAHSTFMKLRAKSKYTKWWQIAVIAGLGLGLLYLLGGPLVEFTGNESIAPLIKQATSLGITGILWILVVKVVVIGWSKAMGYRGGLIFPMIFVASSLVAIAQLIFKDANFGACLIAAMAGILAAEKKSKDSIVGKLKASIHPNNLSVGNQLKNNHIPTVVFLTTLNCRCN